MRYLLLFLLPLFIFAKPFKVATYNVENLFDAEYVGTEYDDYRVKHNWTQRMVDIKLNHTAEVICDLDAQVLGLQEIENSNILEQLKKRLSRVGCGYRYSAITSKKDASIQVALLSRFPIKKQRELQVSYSPRVRNILEVEVDVGGEPLWVFVNHWKSRAYHGVESKRMKYAKVLKKRLDTLSESKPYIVLGDFNTDYDAHLSLEKKIDDTNGRTGLHHVMNIAKDGYLMTEYDMLQSPSGYHYTLWKELALDQRWNTKFYGKKGTADHIILPSTLFDKKGIDYVNNSFKVFRKSYLFTKQGYINRWQYKNGKHTGKGYSDHLPVYAYFDTKPYKGERKKKRSKVIEKKRIDDLYTIESLERKIQLDDVVVVLKRGRHAVVKQSRKGRGIFLYGCAGSLEEGNSYDLLAEGIKRYKGLKEITHAYKLKEKGKVDLEGYYLNATLAKDQAVRQNEVVTNLKGIYKNKHFYVEGRKIPIYFKKKKLTPKNGSRLKIHYGHIGYYKKLQLVIYSKKDFEILE